ncbi:exosome complex component RRP43-like isoform X1 [Rhopalosiphum padi]|uniref:exosome complex component RRP43-like isoform X1 n=2 Tax=Rhopalosiphum padi TaxID=40932 RepID=UPI00298E9360|nr:exosome complex component RRP43-like isoform X1 [Rhopalosiphum padi]
MNSIKKNIQDTYAKEYLALNKRNDGRELMSFRDASLNLNTIHTADGSAAVKIGNTAVVCGIKAELGVPKSETPDIGYLLVNVELPSLCSKKIRPGIPCDEAMQITSFLNEVCNNCKILDLQQLCISVDKLVWVLSCDVYCLNYDGSVLDACLIALLSALKTVKIPEVKYDKETEETIVIENYIPLKVNSLPVSSTFGVFNEKYILADPTEEEEQLCVSKLTVVTNGSLLFSLHKPGGEFIKDGQIQNCIRHAQNRTNTIHQLIKAAQ